MGLLKLVLSLIATIAVTTQALADVAVVRHPGGSSRSNGFAIVFVHGLTGGPSKTFTNSNGVSWHTIVAGDTRPLAERLENSPIRTLAEATIYSVDYSSLTEAVRANASVSIEDIAQAVASKDAFRAIFRDHRNVWIVAHSMGGVVTKRALVKLNASDKELIAKLTGISLVAVPANGAPLANQGSETPLGRMIRYVWGASEQQIKELTRVDSGNSFLQLINNDWANFVDDPTRRGQIQLSCAHEMLPTAAPYIGALGVSEVIVPQLYSEDKCTGERVRVRVDHFEIARPRDRDAAIHEFLFSSIRKAIQASPRMRRSDIGDLKLRVVAGEWLEGEAPVADYSGGYATIATRWITNRHKYFGQIIGPRIATLPAGARIEDGTFSLATRSASFKLLSATPNGLIAAVADVGERRGIVVNGVVLPETFDDVLSLMTSDAGSVAALVRQSGRTAIYSHSIGVWKLEPGIEPLELVALTRNGNAFASVRKGDQTLLAVDGRLLDVPVDCRCLNRGGNYSITDRGDVVQWPALRDVGTGSDVPIYINGRLAWKYEINLTYPSPSVSPNGHVVAHGKPKWLKDKELLRVATEDDVRNASSYDGIWINGKQQEFDLESHDNLIIGHDASLVYIESEEVSEGEWSGDGRTIKEPVYHYRVKIGPGKEIGPFLKIEHLAAATREIYGAIVTTPEGHRFATFNGRSETSFRHPLTTNVIGRPMVGPGGNSIAYQIGNQLGKQSLIQNSAKILVAPWSLSFDRLLAFALDEVGNLSALAVVNGKMVYAVNDKLVASDFDRGFAWAVSEDGKWFSALVGNATAEGVLRYKIIVKRIG